MSPLNRRAAVAATATALVALGATACGGSSQGSPPSTVSRSGAPTRVYPGPAGLVGAAQPQPNGVQWLLVSTPSAANLQQLNLSTGAISDVVPVTVGAGSLAQSPSGVVGVGVATPSTGALELHNGASGALIATVPVGAPVRAVAAGTDGTTFYVLNGNGGSASVTLVNATTDKTSVSVPVPLSTVAIAVSPGGSNLYALTSGGDLDVIAVGNGQVASSFTVGAHAIALAVSPTGNTIYVLKRAAGTADVGVVDVATEGQVKAVAAPADSVAVQVSTDGSQLYLAVGTATVGNIQVFPAPA